MMGIKKTIIKAVFMLASNPRLFFKVLLSRIMPKKFMLKMSIKKRINGVLFEYDFNLDPTIKYMYFGCYEPEVVEVIKSVLKCGNVFIDVGASIGYLSAVGAGFVGKRGQIHSFEPVPQYFQKLDNMAKINPDYRIIVNQCALGENEGTVNIDVTGKQNIGWNTVIPGHMKKEDLKETLKVPICRLDNYIKQKALNNISLIKIDVEGFEFPVLKGLSNYFKNVNRRPAIICEIAPHAYPLLGYTLIQLREYMKRYNYKAYSLYGNDIEIDLVNLIEITKLIFKPFKII